MYCLKILNINIVIRNSMIEFFVYTKIDIKTFESRRKNRVAL